MPNQPFGTGCGVSPKDIRTFAYAPSPAPVKGGTRYDPIDIEHQHTCGVCTAISMTMNASKALGNRFSADFQYLCQKKYYDLNWDEGSSIFHALKVAKNIGFLPVEQFADQTGKPYATEEDRKLPYYQYIQKLQAIPDTEIERLKGLCIGKITAYASVPVDRNSMASAIVESRAGILARYDCGNRWWTPPIEPLQPSAQVVSGHAVTDSNFDGQSFRIANSWGSDWADGGTAYRLQSLYRPSEAWHVYYNDSDTPQAIHQQLLNRVSLLGKLLDLLQKFIQLTQKK